MYFLYYENLNGYFRFAWFVHLHGVNYNSGYVRKKREVTKWQKKAKNGIKAKLFGAALFQRQ
jgi:hypothetical protein